MLSQIPLKDIRNYIRLKPMISLLPSVYPRLKAEFVFSPYISLPRCKEIDMNICTCKTYALPTPFLVYQGCLEATFLRLPFCSLSLENKSFCFFHKNGGGLRFMFLVFQSMASGSHYHSSEIPRNSCFK